jgi:hypothetical protein
MQDLLKKKYLISFRRFVNCKSGNNTIVSYIGMNMIEYRIYIQHMFQPDMNWSNYLKYWNIDHIVPLCHFDLTNENDKKLAFHAYNTIPMYSRDNKLKGSDCYFAIECLKYYKDDIHQELYIKAKNIISNYNKYIVKYIADELS